MTWIRQNVGLYVLYIATINFSKQLPDVNILWVRQGSIITTKFWHVCLRAAPQEKDEEEHVHMFLKKVIPISTVDFYKHSNDVDTHVNIKEERVLVK